MQWRWRPDLAPTHERLQCHGCGYDTGWVIEKQNARYRETMGRDPVTRFGTEHPDRWMWDYAGRKSERDGLLERLEIERDAEQPTQEESLF